MRRLCLSLLALAAMGLSADLASALGFGLRETKEQLKLQYAVSAVDHGTGRVTVSLAIADEGRLKPLSAIKLMIPAEPGSGFVDLSVALATREAEGKQLVDVHLKRELAERAELHLTTSTLDGKQRPRTWYYHAIPLAAHVKDAAPAKP